MIYKEGRLVTSYSQIDKFLQCPKNWAFKYVEKIQIPEMPAKALEYGLAIHETLEAFFRSVAKHQEWLYDKYTNIFEHEYPDIMSLEKLLEVYELIWEMRKIPFVSEEEEVAFKKEGRIALERLYNPIIELERLMVNARVVAVEKHFELPIKLDEPISVKTGYDEYGEEIYGEFDTVWVIGFIDLVIETEAGIIVIDHKSGATLFDKEKLATNLQFPIYAMHIKLENGKLPIKSYYNFTKLHKQQEVLITEERLEEARIEMIKIFKKMARAKYSAKPSYLCYWCDYSKHKAGVCKFSSDFKPKSAK